MIPFLPPQNPNALAGLAGMAGGMPGSRPEAGSPGFAPVFGGAVAGQILAALPADALAGTGVPAGPDAVAWSKFTEVVRIASLAGKAQTPTLIQLRNALLSSIESLRQALSAPAALSQAGETVVQPEGVPAGSTAVTPVEGTGVTGTGIAPTEAETEPGIPVRRAGDPVGQDMSAVFVVAGIPAPAPASAGSVEMTADEALAVLERFVARAPLAEIPSLARGLRQVMVARPAAQPAAGAGEASAAEAVPVSPAQSSVQPASPAPRAGVTVSAPASPAGTSGPAAPGPVPAAPVLEGNGTVPSTAPVRVPVDAVVPASPSTVAPVEAPAIPVQVTAGLTVSPEPLAAVANPAPAAGNLEAPGTAILPAAGTDNEVPVQLALFEEPEGFPGAAIVSSAPLAEGEDPLAFISMPPRAAAAAVSAQADGLSVVPGLDEPDMGEPVAWLARQARGTADMAETVLAETNGQMEAPEEIRPAPSGAVPAPARNASPAAVAVRPEGGPVPAPTQAFIPAGDIPAISITTLDLAADRAIPAAPSGEAVAEPVRAASAAPVQAAGVPASPVPPARQAQVVAPATARQESVPPAPPAAGGVPAPTGSAALSGSPEPAYAAAVSPSTAPVPSAQVVEPAGQAPVAQASRPPMAAPAPVQAAAVPAAPVTARPASPSPAPESVPVSGQTPMAETSPAPAGPAVRSEAVPEAVPARTGEEPRAAVQPRTGDAGPRAAESGISREDGSEPAPVRAGAVRRGAEEAVSPSMGAREAVTSARAQSTEAAALPAAVQAVLSRIAEEVAASRPGRVREIELTVNTPELGAVRIRFEAGEEGTVRVVIRTQTEQAAQGLRDGLPTLRTAMESVNTRVSFDVAQAAVGTAADFGNGRFAPHQRPESPVSFQSSAQPAGRDEPEPASRTLDGYPRRRTLVDVLA